MAQSPQLDHVIGLIKARLATPRKTVDEDRLAYETTLSSMALDNDRKQFG